MDKALIVAKIEQAIALGVSPFDLSPVPSLRLDSHYAAILRATTVTAPPGTLDELVATLAQQPDLDLFNGGYMNTGLGVHKVTLDQLAKWLVAQSLTWNSQEALDRLDRFLHRQHQPALEILGIAGIELDRSVDLIKGIRLVPFSEIPELAAVEMLDRYGDGAIPYFDGISFRAPMSAAMVAHYSDLPRLSKDAPGPSDPIWSQLKRWIMYKACTVLTLFGPSAPAPAIYWIFSDPSVPLGQAGVSWGITPHEIYPTKAFQLKDCLDEVQSLIARYFDLPALVQTSLEMVLTRLNLSMRRMSPADAAVELRIALEALLARELDENAPIGYSIRLRGACLAASSAQDRRYTFDVLRKVYNLGSKAVHTGAVETDALSWQLLHEGQQMCADLAKKVIENGKFPDWMALVLGGG